MKLEVLGLSPDRKGLKLPVAFQEFVVIPFPDLGQTAKPIINGHSGKTKGVATP